MLTWHVLLHGLEGAVEGGAGAALLLLTLAFVGVWVVLVEVDVLRDLDALKDKRPSQLTLIKRPTRRNTTVSTKVHRDH